MIRVWLAGFRDAIGQHGAIQYGRTFGDARDDTYDRGLNAGERIARLIWR